MMSELLKHLNDNTLTEKMLLIELIGDIGGSFYSYMVYLKQQKRSKEAKLIEDIRTEIFDTRYLLRAEHYDKVEMSKRLKVTRDKALIVGMMLETDPARSWELMLIGDTCFNDWLNLIYLLNPNPQAVKASKTDSL